MIPGSRITRINTLHTPTGDYELVWFELSGRPLAAISAGPLFKFNPSVSFHIRCNTGEEVDAMGEKLSKGGKVLLGAGIGAQIALPFRATMALRTS